MDTTTPLSSLPEEAVSVVKSGDWVDYTSSQSYAYSFEETFDKGNLNKLVSLLNEMDTGLSELDYIIEDYLTFFDV